MNVGDVARLTGVTVRTLHHYDRIGLVRPADRSSAGYRLYGAQDLDRLQQVLVYRELGFPLEEVATLLDDPEADPAEHLRRQHRLLRERIERTQAMVAAVEKEMEARHMGISLTPEERFDVFGDWLPEEYAAEAEQEYGDTEAWAQSQRRTAAYTKEDWLRIRAEDSALEQRFAAAMRDGVPADSAAAMDLAEEHRGQITRHYYDCSDEIHAGLGRMYLADERFTGYYERIAPGLAQYVSTAVQANAARQ